MDAPTFRLPHTADQLIDLLDAAFPLRNPSPTATLAETQRAAGTRDVIDFLRGLQQERDTTLDEGVFSSP